MKKFLSLLLTFSILFTTAPFLDCSGVFDEFAEKLGTLKKVYASQAFSEGYCGDTSDGSDGTNLSWVLDPDGVLTISGTGKMTNTSPFSFDLRIKSVVMENSVTSISEYAFKGCTNLESVTLSNNLTTISVGAFYECTSLEAIVIPEGVAKVDDDAFRYCSSLSSIEVPSTLQYIESFSFAFCDALEHIDLPDTLVSLGWSCFSNSGLTDIKIPSGIDTIPYGAFIKTCISDIVIPDNIVEISPNAFYEMRVPVNSITLSSNLKEIGGACFTSSLKNNTITEIVIPDSVEYLGSGAFSINSITKAKIGKNVKTFDRSFSETGNLKSIEIDPENQYIHSYDDVVYNSDYSQILWLHRYRTGKLTFPKELKGFTKEYLNSSDKTALSEYAIEDGAENFAVVDGVLYTKDMKTLYRCPVNYSKTLIMPDTVTTIERFALCWTNIDVKFSKNLKTIKYYAFHQAGTPTKLVLPEGLTTLEEESFKFCRYTSVVIPDSVTNLDVSVFSLSYIESAHLGANTKFNSNAPSSLYGYFGSKLSELTISSENPYYSVYDGVLYNKDLSEMIYIPYARDVINVPADTSKLCDIPRDTMAININENNPYYKSSNGCLLSKDGTYLYRIQDSAQTIVLPDGIKEIGDDVLFQNTNLKYLTIPEGVEKIGGRFAYYSKNLLQVKIPSTLKEVKAFEGCEKLNSIVLTEGVESVYIYAGCKNLTNIALPKSCKYFTVAKQYNSQHTYSYFDDITVNNPNCEIINYGELNEEITIRGYCGSQTHKVALKRNSNFISLGHSYLDWYTYKPATFEADGIERRDCAYCDAYEERDIPKLKHETHTATFVADGIVVSTVEFYDTMTEIEEPAVPEKDRYLGEWEDYTLGDEDITINAKYTLITSNNASEIKTDSTIEHYYLTDDVQFNLKASSAAKVVKSVISKSVPLDIVLVVDQSGSMDDKLGGNQKKVDALKSAATDFVNLVCENAKQTGADHRIAITGFGIAGNYIGYSENENTELLTTADGNPVVYHNITSKDYAGSMLNVLEGNSVNPALLDAIHSIEADGATAADRGLEMAKGIYANNDSTDRERVVIFMTDGEPTYSNRFDFAVANSAISNANVLKNTYGASVYSVGIFDYYQRNNRNINNFMNAVSSDYPNAVSLNNIGKKQSDHYFNTVDNTDLLSGVFKTITKETLSHTASFDKLTFIKTLSKYVTLTSEQEKELRINLIRDYGITDNDIIITRNSDGTTVVKVNNLSPYEVTDDEGNVTYEVTMSFFASLNEKASDAGEYYVDTEDSGVILGDANGYEATFVPSKITLSSNVKRFIFNINNEVYDITEGNTAIEAVPETEFSNEWIFSGWNTNSSNNKNGEEFNATLTKKNRTITWHTAQGDIVQYYQEGDTIIPPQVSDREDGRKFLGWDSSLPTVMKDSNLEFTAVYGEHIHKFVSNIVKSVTCTEDGMMELVCECGESSDEIIKAAGHHFEAITPTTENSSSSCTFVCTICGEKYDYALNYKIIDDTHKQTRLMYEFNLTDDNLEIGFEPDETISIRIPVSKFQGSSRKATVVRTNDDGSKTVVPCTMENGYLIIKTDHFSSYEINFDYECQITGEHIDEDKDRLCDSCNAQCEIDNSALVAAIDQASDLSAEDYSAESYGVISSLVDDYIDLKENSVSQYQYDKATFEILTAMTELVPYLIVDVNAENGNVQADYENSKIINEKNYILLGSNVTLTAVADEGYTFYGWYNTTTKTYMSRESVYTFKAIANTDLIAIFKEDNSSTLTFTTYSNWVKDEITKTVDEWNEMTSIEDLLPEVPYRYGYSNGRWVYDNEDVLSKLRAGENVSIVAEYDADVTSLPTLPTPNVDVPVLDLYYKLDADENIGSFVMATGIPENCQIESVGMAFYYKNANQFNPGNFELLLNNKMLTSTFELDDSNIYIANVERFTSKNNWAVRGYITYYDADGNLKTVYSNQINIVEREQV